MSTPLERLNTIVSNVSVSRVKYVGTLEGDGTRIGFKQVKTQNFYLKPNEDKLQELLRDKLTERFEYQQAAFTCEVKAEDLFTVIKTCIIKQYGSHTDRCKATQRKTESFIRSIKLEDPRLSSYIVAMFIEINSPEWARKTAESRTAYLETLESLRRVYGK